MKAQRQALLQADQALQQTRAELQHRQHLRLQHQLHLQALALAQAQVEEQARTEALLLHQQQEAAAQALLAQQQLQQAAQAAVATQSTKQSAVLASQRAAATARGRAGASASRASTPLSAADPFHLDMHLQEEHDGSSGSGSGADISNSRVQLEKSGNGGGIASTPAVGTSGRNRSASEATTAFMSPDVTFPVPYAETATNLDSCTDSFLNPVNAGGEGRGAKRGAGTVLPAATSSQQVKVSTLWFAHFHNILYANLL